MTPVGDTVDDNLHTQMDTAITFNVLTGTNGASADNFEGTPNVTSFTQGAHGTVTIAADGLAVYTPNTGFSGVDTFTYTVTSPTGVIETATVTISVNDPPCLLYTSRCV